MQPRNPYLCLTVVALLGAALILSVGAVLACVLAGQKPPDLFGYIATTALGSLASFLVAVPRGSVGGGSTLEGSKKTEAAPGEVVPARAA